MKAVILGGGLAGLSLAYFLQDDPRISAIDILEKENEPGGLCRSFDHDGLTVDIGPHIFFSKDKETLRFMLDMLGDNQRELRRSNQVIHKGKLIQYPFENDLSKLPPEDRERCVSGFMHNPYRAYPADNMLQFFLKTFGEGITNLYLRPYNEKIWKYDPAFMDTQMVERIPRPPDEDILRSAAGETVDGYTHQLYFSYPEKGGMAAFVRAFMQRMNDKVTLHTSHEVTSVNKTEAGYWTVEADGQTFGADQIISCIPVNILTRIYKGAEADICACASALKYNHILIATATVAVDRAGDNLAFMNAESGVPFHRLTKLDFFGSNYHKPNTATYMMEYTYRDGDALASRDDAALRKVFADGLKRIGFIENEREVLSFSSHRYPYAYVIYDLNHSDNMRALRAYFSAQGALLNGRFGNFEYWNMDRVIAESRWLAEQILSR